MYDIYSYCIKLIFIKHVVYDVSVNRYYEKLIINFCIHLMFFYDILRRENIASPLLDGGGGGGEEKNRISQSVFNPFEIIFAAGILRRSFTNSRSEDCVS